jgi:hypothetical protein
MGKKIIATLAALTLSFLLTGCGAPERSKSSPFNGPHGEGTATAKYDIIMTAVEKSTLSTGRTEAQKVETVYAEGTARYRNEDASVMMEWQPGPVDIVVSVRNKTVAPVTVVWKEARFIDERGISRRLIHSGIGYEERNLPLLPTIIAGGTTLNDFVHPLDYFEWETVGTMGADRKGGYWDRAPYLPVRMQNGTATDFRTRVMSMVGKTFHVMLPLVIGQIRSDYLCTFRINYADISQAEAPRETGPEKQERGTGRPERRRP